MFVDRLRQNSTHLHDKTVSSSASLINPHVKTSAAKQEKCTPQKTVDTTPEGAEMATNMPPDWPVVTGDLVLVKWNVAPSNSPDQEFKMGRVCAYPICYHHRLLVYLLSMKYL